MAATLLKTEPPPAALYLAELTRRIAREMRRAAAIADDCQDAIDWDEAAALSAETVTRLQGLDMLSQQLIELGRVLDRLSDEGARVAVPTQILDDVRLGDLKHRLEEGSSDAALVGANGGLSDDDG